MNSKIIFLGDVHLGVNPKNAIIDRESHLISFFLSLRGNVNHIVILGDLFEFWFEYRFYVSNEHFELFYTLKTLVDSGIKISLLRGNHDFALGAFFPKNLGVQVCNTLKLQEQGKRIFCTHGDGVITSDKSYRTYRKILDCPLNQKIFRWIHPDLGMKIAKYVGDKSRKKGYHQEIHLDEYLEWGERVLKKNSFDLCIHGHHHIAGIWETSSGIIASPGEWIKKLTYLQLEDGELLLKEWKV